MLLLHVQPGFPQPVRQRVLINLLQVSVPVVNVNVIGDLANLAAQHFEVFHGFL